MVAAPSDQEGSQRRGARASFRVVHELHLRPVDMDVADLVQMEMAFQGQLEVQAVPVVVVVLPHIEEGGTCSLLWDARHCSVGASDLG